MRLLYVIIGIAAAGIIVTLKELSHFINGFEDPFTNYFCEEGGEADDKEES